MPQLQNTAFPRRQKKNKREEEPTMIKQMSHMKRTNKEELQQRNRLSTVSRKKTTCGLTQFYFREISPSFWCPAKLQAPKKFDP